MTDSGARVSFLRGQVFTTDWSVVACCCYPWSWASCLAEVASCFSVQWNCMSITTRICWHPELMKCWDLWHWLTKFSCGTAEFLRGGEVSGHCVVTQLCCVFGNTVLSDTYKLILLIVLILLVVWRCLIGFGFRGVESSWIVSCFLF